MARDLLSFTVDALAVRRLVRLVTVDEIAAPLRRSVGEIDPRLDYLVHCPSCTSVWAAAVVLMAPRVIRRLLAASETAILIGQAADLLERKAAA